jgi:hypothetical protein
MRALERLIILARLAASGCRMQGVEIGAGEQMAQNKRALNIGIRENKLFAALLRASRR